MDELREGKYKELQLFHYLIMDKGVQGKILAFNKNQMTT